MLVFDQRTGHHSLAELTRKINYHHPKNNLYARSKGKSWNSLNNSFPTRSIIHYELSNTDFIERNSVFKNKNMFVCVCVYVCKRELAK